MVFIAQAAATISHISIQVLMVLMPMVVNGAYSIFCWLLAEPIVMPIWNHLLKPAYDILLCGLHKLAMMCRDKWCQFWGTTPTTQKNTQQDIEKKLFKEVVTVQSPAQEPQRAAQEPQQVRGPQQAARVAPQHQVRGLAPS